MTLREVAVCTKLSLTTLGQIERLEKGDRVRFEARDALPIRIGDPQMFSYTVNGRPGRSLGESGQPITVRITPQNHDSFVAVEQATSS